MVDASTFTVDENNLTMRIQQAEMYLKEFENEVKRAQGGTPIFRSREDALSRIKILNEFAPNDPRVKELFQRASKCVTGSAGNFKDITDDMIAYLKNEEQFVAEFSKKSEQAWNDLVAQYQDKMLEKVYPAPDVMNTQLDDMVGKYVVLDDVQYPLNQFLGMTGEFIHVGQRSTGMYFVKIDSRRWLGPYEAIKRYRRQVDSTMAEVTKWTVLGEITSIAMEIPQAGEEKVGSLVYATVVEPVALYVPGHVVGIYSAEHEKSGYFYGEDDVASIKEGWYTVKSVPDDVTPERLVEIFQQAIKEKNYDLYLDCIHPDLKESDFAKENMRYHWDLHQERFHGEYVYAEVDPEKTEIVVVKGYDDTNDLNNYFMSKEDQEKIASHYGDKVEYAYVTTVAYDIHGKQLGSPNKRTLQRTNGGRWYIREYDVRF
ncbi:MAG: hypothetical protein J6U23_06145 [Clostridiales bacterium]|nr:hypothetical protein [Clostridiales bacterium]